MSNGIKESADESDLECFRRPEGKFSTVQLASTSQRRTKYDFAAVQYAYNLISGGTVGFDFQQF